MDVSLLLSSNIFLRYDSIFLKIKKFLLSCEEDIKDITDSRSEGFSDDYQRVAIIINNTKSMTLKITPHLSIISTMAFPCK